MPRLREAIASGGTARGFHARFAPLDDRWGAKWYADRALAHRCFELQAAAAAFHLAPAVGERFDCAGVSGYVTQIVQPCAPLAWRDSGPQRRLARELFRLARILPADCGWSNTGYLPDGRLVLFDFSCCRFVEARADALPVPHR